jgi:hypothetical protein
VFYFRRNVSTAGDIEVAGKLSAYEFLRPFPFALMANTPGSKTTKNGSSDSF